MRRELVVTAPRADKVKTFFSIGTPQQKAANHWTCEIFIGELFNEPKHASGVDSWHAVQQGMVMIYMELKLRKTFGWEFSWFDGEESDLESILPRPL